MILAVLLTSVQWFGFWDSLRMPASEMAQLTEDRLIHAILQQSRVPQHSIITVRPPAPCDVVDLFVLAGGSVVAENFECLNHVFQTLPSGSVRYAPQS